jgi:hypothetical protein
VPDTMGMCDLGSLGIREVIMGEAKRRKLSRDAAPGEIFPGSHGPVQSQTLVEAMTLVMDTLKKLFGEQFHISLFLAEKESSEGRELPRFNYMSTAEREDMIAVMKAFVAKNSDFAKAEKINEEPPTNARQ